MLGLTGRSAGGSERAKFFLSVLFALAAIFSARLFQYDSRTTFANAEGESVCGNWTGEFNFLFDVSESFSDDIKTLRILAPELFAKIADAFPGAKFGVGTFSDKAIYPLGEKGDSCYRTRLGLTTDQKAAADIMYDIEPEGGYDEAESQLDALFHSMRSSTVGWSKDTHDADYRPVLRANILATDAPYHRRGDAKVWDHSIIDSPLHPEPNCTAWDYPKRMSVEKQMTRRNVKPIFLISGAEMQELYEDLLTHLPDHGSVHSLATDSSDLVSVVMKALAKLSCEVPTPLPPGVTTTTTTRSPTTTVEGQTTTTKTRRTTTIGDRPLTDPVKQK